MNVAQCFARDKIRLPISARDEAKLNQAAEALRMAGSPTLETVFPADPSDLELKAVHRVM